MVSLFIEPISYHECRVEKLFTGKTIFENLLMNVPIFTEGFTIPDYSNYAFSILASILRTFFLWLSDVCSFGVPSGTLRSSTSR